MKAHQSPQTILINAANRNRFTHDEAGHIIGIIEDLKGRVLGADQIIMAVGVFYDQHRDFVMELEKRGIIKEGGLYRENLPLILTVMAKAFRESKKAA